MVDPRIWGQPLFNPTRLFEVNWSKLDWYAETDHIRLMVWRGHGFEEPQAVMPLSSLLQWIQQCIVTNDLSGFTAGYHPRWWESSNVGNECIDHTRCRGLWWMIFGQRLKPSYKMRHEEITKSHHRSHPGHVSCHLRSGHGGKETACLLPETLAATGCNSKRILPRV